MAVLYTGVHFALLKLLQSQLQKIRKLHVGCALW